MTNRFVKSSIHFHVICNPMFNKLYDFILLCFTLYNFCHFSIFFIFYNHLFIDVYARNSWCVRLSRLRGRVTGTGMPSYPAAREAPRSRCRAHAFFIQGSSSSSCNRLLRSLGRAPSKRSSRLTAAARSFLRDFTIFILYLIYRHQIFCASSASARASLRAAAFSFSITAWKEKTSSLMTGARTRMEIRFGIAMRAFAISERFQTRSRV